MSEEGKELYKKYYAEGEKSGWDGSYVIPIDEEGYEGIALEQPAEIIGYLIFMDKMVPGFTTKDFYAKAHQSTRDIGPEKILDYIDSSKLVEKDGKKGFYLKSKNFYETHERPFFEVTEDTTFADWSQALSLENTANNLTQTFVSAQVDVDKKTESFYLHNAYNLTDKLELTAGLRYEQARYKGERKTNSFQKLEIENWDNLTEKEKNNELLRVTSILKMYAQTSDALPNIKEYDKIEEVMDEIVRGYKNDIKENGHVIIPMSELTNSYTKTEDNIGGELGLTYSLNDTDQVYARYERAFNSPLPTQMTNKTFDPVHKMRLYWDSNLTSETMNNFEIGYRGMLTDNISLSGAAFLSDTNNEIVTLVKDGNSHMTREWRYMNIDKTRRVGFELQSEQNFDKLHLKESFTYVHPEILSNNYKEQIRKINEEKRESLISMYRANCENVLSSYVGVPQNVVDKALAIYKTKEFNDNVLDDMKVNDIISKYVDNHVMDDIKEFVGQNTDWSQAQIQDAEDEYRNRVTAIIQGYTDKEREVERSYQTEEETLENGSFLEKGDRIPMAPKYKATLSADYQFTDKLKLGTNFNYIGSFISVEPARGYEVGKTKVPAHWVTDVYGTYDVTPDFSVKFGINNVFNHEYNLRQDSYTATPAAKRTYTAGFTYTF